MAEIMHVHRAMAMSHASLWRGRVWCRSCGSSTRIDAAEALARGWPKCCGATMTVDAPAEQAALRAPSHGG